MRYEALDIAIHRTRMRAPMKNVHKTIERQPKRFASREAVARALGSEETF